MIKTLCISLFLFAGASSFATDNLVNKHNWQIAKQLVITAEKFASKHKQLMLIDAINGGQFVSKDSYVFALSADNYLLAHPYRKDIIGQHNVLGEKYSQRMLDIIKQYGEGWIEYHFTDPSTGKDVPKLSYIKRVSPAVFIGAGVY
ncbi:Methyl-accepting chemotaxis protein [uncultured Candidatus Thioglobus sp.]|nr:Methyl-accepting chemotaxis protein [uncultured Candidatus Thioglobus sp.]